MTRPCWCGGTLIDTCNCAIVAGPNTTVSGTGTGENPYVITAGTTQFKVTDSPSVDLTLTGDGAAAPYNLTAAVRRNPATANLLTQTASGLMVACGAVQDCVAEAMGPGLAWNEGDRRFEAHISTEPGNLLLIGPDGGLYASNDGTIAPARPRGRVWRSTVQQIPTGAGLNTAIEFDTELSDIGGTFDSDTPTRLTAPVDGGYTVGCAIEWQSLGANANSGDRLVFLRANGTTTLVADRRDAARSVPTNQALSTTVDLQAGDYIETYVRHIQGAALNLVAAVSFAPLMFMYLTTEGI